jgi:hypothetical protein
MLRIDRGQYGAGHGEMVRTAGACGPVSDSGLPNPAYLQGIKEDFGTNGRAINLHPL